MSPDASAGRADYAPETYRVLAVDDQPEVLSALRRLLRRRGFEVIGIGDPAEALETLRSDPLGYDLILLDINMPGMSGLELLPRARKLSPHIPVVMLTADDSAGSAVAALRAGEFNYLTKPLDDPDTVALTLARACQYGMLERRARRLEERIDVSARFETLVGSSRPMRELFATLDKLAASDVNVLIGGESGTGKELAARAIHNRSSRSHGPFVALNCGAIPEQLIDSELFGHAKGAFTGAVGSRPGVFAEADGGTLFLDEIGDIPAPVQLRLLRVLQEREVRAVGGTGSRSVDVRVISATHVDLDDAVAGKKFRADLFYRLNVISLVLPALRDRLDDVPLLAAHLLQKHAAHQGRLEPRFSARAISALSSYSWPGNVRELENAIQRALALTPGDEIDVEALPAPIAEVAASAPASPAPRQPLAPSPAQPRGSRAISGDGIAIAPLAPAGDTHEPGPCDAELCPRAIPTFAEPVPFSEARKRAQAAFERAYLQRLLDHTQGNISEAARLAGLDRSNLRRVLSRHGIDPDHHRPADDRRTKTAQPQQS